MPEQKLEQIRSLFSASSFKQGYIFISWALTIPYPLRIFSPRFL